MLGLQSHLTQNRVPLLLFRLLVGEFHGVAEFQVFSVFEDACVLGLLGVDALEGGA